MSSILSIQIQSNSKVLVPWTILSSYNVTDTFVELYRRLQSENSLNKFCLNSAKIGVSKTTSFDNVEFDVRVIDAVTTFGRFVRLNVQHEDETSALPSSSSLYDKCSGNAVTSTASNAFEILMNGSRKLSLPERYDLDKVKVKKNLVLYNKIVDTLEQCNLGFTYSGMESGKHFVRVPTDCIWYIDPHIEKMEQRSCRLPTIFEHLSGYHDPERSKYKLYPLNRDTLLQHATTLDHVLEQTWIGGPMWIPIKSGVEGLSEMLYKYSDYLQNKSKKTSENHERLFPIHSKDESQTVQVIFPKLIVKPTFASRYKPLNDHLTNLDYFQPICVDEYTPPDTRNRRYYVDNLKHGIQFKCAFFRMSGKNSTGTHNFLWRIPNSNEPETVKRNPEVISSLNKQLPVYHTRAMRREFVLKASLMYKLPSSAAKTLYRNLTGDRSAPTNETDKEIEQRAQQAFDMQDPDVIVDLREHNPGRPSKYELFFEKAKEYIENVVEHAVDDRRHDNIVHLATAISVPDLLRQVALKCPPETPIPSASWLRLQFAPKNPSSYSSLQYTGKLNVKFQVQSRQLRKNHIAIIMQVQFFITRRS